MQETPTNPRTARIAELNDLARTAMGVASRLFQTQGVNALDRRAQSEIREKVELFSDFNEDNDPWGEHDFGSFHCLGQDIYWKIDCYNRDLTGGSEDPSDPAQTSRVLTIMLQEEY